MSKCLLTITNRQRLYDISLMAAMYDDYSTKLTAAQYTLDCILIASPQILTCIADTL